MNSIMGMKKDGERRNTNGEATVGDGLVRIRTRAADVEASN